jgi:hypothetical protein
LIVAFFSQSSDEYGELCNKKAEATSETRQLLAELETQTTLLQELRKKNEEDSTFLAEAESLKNDNKKVCTEMSG